MFLIDSDYCYHKTNFNNMVIELVQSHGSYAILK